MVLSIYIKTDVFLSYLAREKRIYEEILANLCKNGLADEKRKSRYAKIEELLRDCQKVCSLLE